MKATKLIQQLQAGVDEHGDLDVVSGVHLTGYGSPVLRIANITAQTLEGEMITALDLVISDDALVAVGGF